MTPAPWTLKQHAMNHQTLTGATAGLIADIHKDEDAMLLAAAPDLLAALELIEANADYGKDNPKRQTAVLFDILEIARAAIAKATGEQA